MVKKYNVAIKGCESKKIEFTNGGLFSPCRLCVDGVRIAQRGFWNRYFVFIDDAGQEIKVKLKYHHMSFVTPDIPVLLVGDQIVTLEKPLEFYEYVWCGLPYIFVLYTLGILGILVIGYPVTRDNILRFRQSKNRIDAYLKSAVSSLLVLLLVLSIAVVPLVAFPDQYLVTCGDTVSITVPNDWMLEDLEEDEALGLVNGTREIALGIFCEKKTQVKAKSLQDYAQKASDKLLEQHKAKRVKEDSLIYQGHEATRFEIISQGADPEVTLIDTFVDSDKSYVRATMWFPSEFKSSWVYGSEIEAVLKNLKVK